MTAPSPPTDAEIQLHHRYHRSNMTENDKPKDRGCALMLCAPLLIDDIIAIQKIILHQSTQAKNSCYADTINCSAIRQKKQKAREKRASKLAEIERAPRKSQTSLAGNSASNAKKKSYFINVDPKPTQDHLVSAWLLHGLEVPSGTLRELREVGGAHLAVVHQEREDWRGMCGRRCTYAWLSGVILIQLLRQYSGGIGGRHPKVGWCAGC